MTIGNNTSNLEVEKEYWLKKLSGEIDVTQFPIIKSHNIDGRLIKDFKFQLDRNDYEQIMSICNNSLHSLHSFLTTVLKVILYKYSGNKDICIGTPIFIDNYEKEYLNNILILRNQVTDYQRFKDFLLSVHQTTTEASRNQNFPITQLGNKLNIQSNNVYDLSNVIIVLDKLQSENVLKNENYDIAFCFDKQDKGLMINIKFNSYLYSVNYVQQLALHFINLIKSVISDLNQPVKT